MRHKDKNNSFLLASFSDIGVCTAVSHTSFPITPLFCAAVLLFHTVGTGCVWHGAALASTHRGSLLPCCQHCANPVQTQNQEQLKYLLCTPGFLIVRENRTLSTLMSDNNKLCLLCLYTLVMVIYSFFFFLL